LPPNQAQRGRGHGLALGRMNFRPLMNRKRLQRRRNKGIAALRHDLPYALLGRFLPRLKAAVATWRPPFFAVCPTGASAKALMIGRLLRPHAPRRITRSLHSPESRPSQLPSPIDPILGRRVAAARPTKRAGACVLSGLPMAWAPWRSGVPGTSAPSRHLASRFRLTDALARLLLDPFKRTRRRTASHFEVSGARQSGPIARLPDKLQRSRQWRRQQFD
jgi:hypothetical protein